MWSPPTRRGAGGAASTDDSGDAGPTCDKDRPYFHAELADLTIAPDIYTYHREGHNLMQYQVSLGTEKLLTAELLRQGRLTLAAPQPTAIPRWFAPGYARMEAAERAIVTDAQRLRTARRDHIDHPGWIMRTSPHVSPPTTTGGAHPAAVPQPSAPASACPDPAPSADHSARPSPGHTLHAPAAASHRLPCFLAITGPQRSVHTMLTRRGAQPSSAAPQPQLLPPPQQQPPPGQTSPPPARATVAEASKYRTCWEQLCRTNIRKADVAVAWRALHCQLRTPSFLTYCRYKGTAVDMSGDTPMQRACCRWPACRAPLATNPTIFQPTTLANTTHVLLHCPLTRPAAQWLCDLWAAIDGGNAPPASPDVIIAGDPTAWHPGRLDVDLWTRVRAIYLQRAWEAHCAVHHSGATPSPTSIAAATLHSAIQAMRTEFTAAYTAPSELAQQCDAHMTGAQQRQSRDDGGDDPVAAFKRVWVASGLCDVVANRLVVRWTTTHPVPLPAAQPQPQPQPPMPPPPPPVPAALPTLHLI